VLGSQGGFQRKLERLPGWPVPCRGWRDTCPPMKGSDTMHESLKGCSSPSIVVGIPDTTRGQGGRSRVFLGITLEQVREVRVTLTHRRANPHPVCGARRPLLTEDPKSWGVMALPWGCQSLCSSSSVPQRCPASLLPPPGTSLHHTHLLVEQDEPQERPGH
jgi:hypothetical protein